MDNTDYKKLIEENFGKLTLRQLWALVKLCKMIRLRARNNSAFNNRFNSIFPYASFRQVQKSRITNGLPQYYPGLEITVDGKTESNEE